MSLNGGKLAGGNPKNARVENDFYATNPKAVDMLFEKEEFKEGRYLEPCVGQGHIAHRIKQLNPNSEVVGMDLVDRGFPNVIVGDFLETSGESNFDYIVTNPPYSLGKEFVENGFTYLKDGGKMAMFMKIQFLEGEKRRQLYKDNPPKYIYVFTKRMATFNNGNELNENGKPWSTTMCHAWFVWEKGFKGETIIRWI